MTGVGQQSRVLLHHKRHPKPGHGGQGIGRKGQSWWWEGVMAQGMDKGTHADKGKGKGWGVPLGHGTSRKGCDKGHQGKQADKGQAC